MNNTIINKKSQVFWLNFRVNNTDTSYFMEQDLPIPTLIQYFNKSYNIHYAIDGFVGTAKLRDYVRDIQEKIALLSPATHSIMWDL